MISLYCSWIEENNDLLRTTAYLDQGWAHLDEGLGSLWHPSMCAFGALAVASNELDAKYFNLYLHNRAK